MNSKATETEVYLFGGQEKEMVNELTRKTSICSPLETRGSLAFVNTKYRLIIYSTEQQVSRSKREKSNSYKRKRNKKGWKMKYKKYKKCMDLRGCLVAVLENSFLFLRTKKPMI